jgi:hypothetical protein
MPEGRAREQFHGEEETAIGFDDIVNRTDVGVIERAGEASFAAESLDGLLAVRRFFGEELQSYGAAQARVFGFEDITHPAAADLLDDAIVGDGSTDHAAREWMSDFG